MEKDIINSVNSVLADEGSIDIRTYSPLTLAYLGDAVYEIVIRTAVVNKGQRPANMLHRHTVKLVCAQTQAKIAEAVYEYMSSEEQDIYRRGKNTKVNSSAKNASLTDYRKATGFEALCGYLFLKNDIERVTELIEKGIELLKIQI